MKKKFFIFLVLLCVPQIGSASDYASLNQKISIVYNERPEIIENINKSIPQIANKYSGSKKATYLHIHQYINYLSGNESFYNALIPKSLKVKIMILEKQGFTNQDFIESLKKLQTNYDYWSIEYELINYYITISQVGILLNHQNFESAESLTKDFFLEKSKRIDFIIENSTYRSFNTLVQLVSWLNTNGDNLKKERWRVFPLEEKTAYNAIRINNNSYSGLDCDSLIILDSSSDTIDYLFCKLFNDSFQKNDIAIADNLSNNIQNLSDRINFYSQIGQKQEYSQEMRNKQEELGKLIVEEDIHFVNGYLALLSIYDITNQCDLFDHYKNQLSSNYIGDVNRKQIVFNRKYINCITN